MRVFVTGASGFVGGHVVSELLAAGHEVRALVHTDRALEWLESVGVETARGDLLDEGTLRSAVRGVDGLIHSAARMGYWSRQNDIQWQINVDGTTKLLRSAHRAKVSRIVHVSSVAAVGATRDVRVLDESAAWMGHKRIDVNYVRTKRESEERVLASARQGIPVVVVNPGVMLGPHARGGAPAGLVRQVASGSTPTVPPGGGSIADVRDVAGGIVAALERGHVGERYILGGHNMSWLELHRALAEKLGVPGPAGEYSLARGRALAFGATALDLVRLSRPRWAPELYRMWGWYGYVDSSRATDELGYRLPAFDEIVGRVTDEWKQSTDGGRG